MSSGAASTNSTAHFDLVSVSKILSSLETRGNREAALLGKAVALQKLLRYEKADAVTRPLPMNTRAACCG